VEQASLDVALAHDADPVRGEEERGHSSPT